MLTIKAPIELKAASFHLGDDGFADRIRDNYSMMGAHVNEQSLTHMIHTPPQILVAEGEQTSVGISNQAFVFNEVQQMLINNVANRILLSNEYGLSYQDRVFITSMLHSMGIRDEQRFMNEARIFLSESSSSNELTAFYMENMPMLREMIQDWHEYREEEPREEEEERSSAAENRLYLQIMNRLQTGMIYQIFQNMHHSSSGDVLNETEINTSEQSYTARQLLLQRFRSITAGEQLPLVYRAENVYEEETRDTEEGGEERIREKINSAMFLEVLRSFDHAQTLRDQTEHKYWMDLRSNFFKSADHSLSRILIEAREGRSPVHYEETRLQLLEGAQRREIETLQELITAQEEAYYEELREAFYRDVDHSRESLRIEEREGQSPQYFEETDMTLLEGSEGLDEETIRELQTQREESRRLERTERERIRESREVVQRQETMEETLERINRQNLSNVERYNEIRRILMDRKEESVRVSDRERTIRESLRSLHDTEHLMKLLQEEEVDTPTAAEKTLEKIYALLPPSTVAILRQLEGGNVEDSRPESIMEDAVYREEPEPVREEQVQRYVEERFEQTQSVVLDRRTRESLEHYERLITRELLKRESVIEERERIERAYAGPAEMLVLQMKLEQGESVQDSSVTLRSGSRNAVIHMIHRVEESLSEEDVLNTLEEYRRNESRTQTVKEEAPHITESRHIEPVRQIETTQRQAQTMGNAEIARLVEQGVRRQLGMISNEVYSRLEKRLKNEKARRGY